MMMKQANKQPKKIITQMEKECGLALCIDI